MWPLIAGCLISAFWVSFLATGLMRLISPRVGLIDKPAARKVHVVPTPLGGGVGIWCGVVIPLAVAQTLILIWSKSPPTWMPLELAEHISGALYRSRELWGIIVAASILAVTGLVDDLRPLSWKLRIAIQFVVSIAVVLAGVRATVFVSNPWIGGVLSVLWFVVLVNSFNFLDNMDGLSGGIALIVSSIFAVMMLTKPGDPYDICSVVFIRLKEGRSPFQPDKKHFSHRLVALGLTKVQAVLTVLLTTLTTGLLGLTLYTVNSWNAAVVVVACVGCILLLIAILEAAPREPPQAV